MVSRTTPTGTRVGHPSVDGVCVLRGWTAEGRMILEVPPQIAARGSRPSDGWYVADEDGDAT